MAENKNITKVTLDLPELMTKELDHLCSEIGLKSKEELFLNALALLKWAANESKDGRDIASIDPKTHRFSSVQMDPLKFIANKA